MNQPEIFAREKKRIPSILEALKARGHQAFFFETKEEALQKILQLIPTQCSVGIPGTLTIRQINAIEALQDRGTKVYEHWVHQGMTAAQAREAAHKADFFLTSANALTEEGQLVSSDGNGNRLAAMCDAAGAPIYVLGLNKLVPHLSAAFHRIKEYAAIQNALRFSPELENDEQKLCKAAQDLIHFTLIIDQAKTFSDHRTSTVILINESLGY